jgi:hypothetical protein
MSAGSSIQREEMTMKSVKGVETNLSQYRAYDANAECCNCGFTGEIYVGRGNKISQEHCPLCGCQDLVRKKATIKQTYDM